MRSHCQVVEKRNFPFFLQVNNWESYFYSFENCKTAKLQENFCQQFFFSSFSSLDCWKFCLFFLMFYFFDLLTILLLLFLSLLLSFYIDLHSAISFSASILFAFYWIFVPMDWLSSSLKCSKFYTTTAHKNDIDHLKRHFSFRWHHYFPIKCTHLFIYAIKSFFYKVSLIVKRNNRKTTIYSNILFIL